MTGTSDGTDTIGTHCALCGRELSPSEYPQCRTVLIDETPTGGEEESVRMVCDGCFEDLETELTKHANSGSEGSA
ncbi:hypothetical protein [Halococcus hamelinensis]|uniref:Uncharacterized protein n=1 Tax=Halococcus hamelinensis 100A6 TaxID=1132509 RepID=M0M5J5_9EURY|nr:hypothetical protein [Halococcus hamelinensis]EMA40673.1 hypothetical protein C447_04106 [Halococcus hamelinensis 100A6]